MLLSDVSQTLVSAFSLAVGSGSGSSCPCPSTSGVSSSSSSLVSTPPQRVKQVSMSLIDEDDDDNNDAGEFFSAAGAVMEPMKPVFVGVASSAARTGTDVQVMGEVEDDDGEWGW